MNYTPQQLAQALMQPVPMVGAPGPVLSPQMTALNPLRGQQPQSGGGGLDLSALMKMFGGLMGGQGGTPQNPYAMGGGGYMDAGSQPMSNVG